MVGDGDVTAAADGAVDLGSGAEGAVARQEKFYPPDGRWERLLWRVLYITRSGHVLIVPARCDIVGGL